MNKFLANLIFCVLSMIASSSSFAVSEKYIFDPQHTCVVWHINHFGFSNPSGKWFANGDIDFDEKNPQKSHVNVTIQLNNVVTGIPELDKHLISPLFFDAAKYPTATFVSDKVAMTGKNTADVHGVLTLHGVSLPITLAVKLNKIGENPISNKMSVGFSAVAALKRSDFGITTLIPGLSDEVKINIEAEANRNKS